MLLQHRAPWSHHGRTWGLPGGARDSHESPEQAALREAAEESGLDPARVRVRGRSRSDHGGWAYETVVADIAERIEPVPQAESLALGWVAEHDVPEHPLHPGLSAAWPGLQASARTLVVDTANVVGARPDGWWRDRVGATRRLVEQAATLIGSVRALPGSAAATAPRWVAITHVVLVLEGVAAVLAEQRPPDLLAAPGWPTRLVAAPRGTAGDATVLAQARNRPDALVVSADRGLRAALPPQAEAIGPSWLLAQLPG